MKNIISRLYSFIIKVKKFIKDEKVNEELIHSKYLTIEDLKVFDDLYLKMDNKIYEAWVTEKKSKKILICYTDDENKLQEIGFIIDNLLNKSIITENNRMLIINKKDING